MTDVLCEGCREKRKGKIVGWWVSLGLLEADGQRKEEVSGGKPGTTPIKDVHLL